MNGFKSSFVRRVHASVRSKATLVCIFLLALSMTLGCESESKTDGGAEGESTAIIQHDDGISASSIVNKTITAYANAQRYSDKGVLYVSYRLQGRAIQEPQPWSVCWERSNKMAMSLFNSQIRYDGTQLSCYVYDIESGNLDNQHLLLRSPDRPPLSELYSDKIATHFIAGHSELPLVKGEGARDFLLVPPATGLLTGQLQQDWLHNAANLQRLADEKIDDQDCYVVRCFNGSDEIDVWIDKASSIIWQADFPTHFLDEKVRSSPDVAELRLIARFHRASFDAPIESSRFALQDRSDATTVSRFVSLPEPLASELIGLKAPKLGLTTPAGTPVTRKEFGDKTTALLWIAGQNAEEAIRKFNTLKKSFSPTKFKFGVVYSDIDLGDPSQGVSMNSELAANAKQTELSFFYDRQLATSSSLRMKSIPAVVVLGPDSKVQFARVVSDDSWTTDVQAAVQRVAAGDDVSSEMLADYQRFLEEYHQQLLASASPLGKSKPPIDRASHRIGNGKQDIEFKKLWNNPRLKSPGNLVSCGQGEQRRIFVLDGWRTVLELNGLGQIKNSYSLDLPDGKGVSNLRCGKSANGEMKFVTFMPGSKQAYAFDSSWAVATPIPVDGAVYGKIKDCDLADINENGKLEAIVAFGNTDDVNAYDVASGAQTETWKTSADSVHGSRLLGVYRGQLVDLKTPHKNLGRAWEQWQLQEVAGFSTAVSIGSMKHNWYAIGIEENGKPAWSLSIGEQMFETPVQSLAFSQDESVVGIANSSQEIHLVTNEGKWLGDFKIKTPLRGFAINKRGETIELIVSSTDGLSCWATK